MNWIKDHSLDIGLSSCNITCLAKIAVFRNPYLGRLTAIFIKMQVFTLRPSAPVLTGSPQSLKDKKNPRSLHRPRGAVFQ
jgi:hypothetical protein